MPIRDDNGDGTLDITSSVSMGNISVNNKEYELIKKNAEQERATKGLYNKSVEFIKTVLRGFNYFEEYVKDNESNDCAFTAKYSKVFDIDVKDVANISTDTITVAGVHVSHPLFYFMSNEHNKGDETIMSEISQTPVIVFIHGMGGQMSQFESLMGLLSQCSELLALDLPGFGNSRLDYEGIKSLSVFSVEEKTRIECSTRALKPSDFTSDSITNVIVNFINQHVAPGKKILLVGHSMGTHLCIKAASRLPKGKVEGFILLSPPSLQNDIDPSKTADTGPTLSMLSFFFKLPFLFDYFRMWDRLEGLNSKSVRRQFAMVTSNGSKIPDPNNNEYNRLRQLRWNIDINSTIVINYAQGFQKAKYSELIHAIEKFNGNTKDRTVYEKVLLISGERDTLTPPGNIKQIDGFLNDIFGRKVSRAIEVKNAGHALLLVKPEYVSGIVLNHLESNFPERLHLSPAWVLKLKAKISGDKWGLKNELKWLKLKPLSDNIMRRQNRDIAPLLGMKTLREGDLQHSPSLLEDLFYGDRRKDNPVKGNLIAIVDISADIPPYSPKTFKRIKYYKCATVSKVVPDKLGIRRFIQLIDDIISSSTEPLPLVAVHCHYGFNRTGYLICCYLIERLGWSVREAVDGFKLAKPPGIKHQHFIDALYVRYES